MDNNNGIDKFRQFISKQNLQELTNIYVLKKSVSIEIESYIIIFSIHI